LIKAKHFVKSDRVLKLNFDFKKNTTFKDKNDFNKEEEKIEKKFGKFWEEFYSVG